MGHNDRMDEGLLDRIRELLELGYFEEGTKEHGIALMVATQGESALSPKQRVVWEKGIIPILNQPITDEESFQQALRQDWEDEARSGSMFFTTADDWLTRFKAAGGILTIDAGGIRPKEGVPVSDQCKLLLAELQGPENKQHWDAVTAEVRARVGGFVGWTDY